MRLFSLQVAVLSALFPILVSAQQSTPSPSDRYLERLEQENQAKEAQKSLQDIKNLPGNSQKISAVANADTDNCFVINTISVLGVASLSDKKIATVTDPFINRCIGLTAIDELLKKITQAYIDQGYVTTRAYIPEQNLKDGSLTIKVMEGKIEEIITSNELDRKNKFNTHWVVGEAKNQTLNLRHLEQNIDYINRLPSNKARVFLQPGEEVGKSKVIIANEKLGKPIRAAFGVRNDGQESTGLYQRDTRFDWDNPLNLADQLSLNVSHDLDDDSEQKSRAWSLSYGLPYRLWLVNLQLSYSDYHIGLQSNGIKFANHGDSQNYTLSTSRLLHRDQISKTNLKIAFQNSASNNYINKNKIGVSSNDLNNLSLSVDHGRQWLKGYWQGELGITRGLGWFGADGNGIDDEANPEEKYIKYTASMYFVKPFQLVNNNFDYTLTIKGQHSSDNLYSNARMSVGGLYTVKGFKEQSLSGNSAYNMRNEITWKPSIPKPLHFFRSIQVMAGYDVGGVVNDSYISRAGRLSGEYVGIKAHSKYLDMSLSYAESRDKPSELLDNEYPVYFNLSFNW